MFLTSVRLLVSVKRRKCSTDASAFLRRVAPPWVTMPLFFTSKLEQDRWCHSFAVVLFDQGEWTTSQENRSRAPREENTQLKLWRRLRSLRFPPDTRRFVNVFVNDTSSELRYYSCVLHGMKVSQRACEISEPLVPNCSLCNGHTLRGKMDRMNDDVCFFHVANETWHISVDHHGVLCGFFYVSIATRKSCGSRFRSSGTAYVTPTPPDQWSGWAAAGSPCRMRARAPERCSTRTDSWSGKSTPTRTAREVRLKPSDLQSLSVLFFL